MSIDRPGVIDGPGVIVPAWPVPSTIHSAITTRKGGGKNGGHSQPPWASFNLATHVGDSKEAVSRNRQLLQKTLALPTEPQWLDQVHGTRVVDAKSDGKVSNADGSYSNKPGRICLVQTADCLPILLCNEEGTEVAALHAGWRGLAAGIVSSGVAKFRSHRLMAYLGPAIGQSAFEVGEDVRRAFLTLAPVWGGEQSIQTCFEPAPDQHWHADLYGLTRLALQASGVCDIYGGNYCTYSEEESFYSYRREGVTGRMASLIWIQP